jgi:hypothetical protein
MESYEHVEHFRIKKHQSWYVHKLGTFKSIKMTTLIIILFLKMILRWIQLQKLCIIVPYPVASLPWFLESLHSYSNSNMRIWVFPIWINSISFQSMFPSTLVNPMFIPIHQKSSWDHLDPYLVHLSLFCLVHIYSNCNCATWVKCEFISNLNSILPMWCCYNPYHSMCLYTMWINEPLELCPHMSTIHTQSNAHLVLFTCIELFNLQIC